MHAELARTAREGVERLARSLSLMKGPYADRLRDPVLMRDAYRQLMCKNLKGTGVINVYRPWDQRVEPGAAPSCCLLHWMADMGRPVWVEGFGWQCPLCKEARGAGLGVDLHVCPKSVTVPGALLLREQRGNCAACKLCGQLMKSQLNEKHACTSLLLRTSLVDFGGIKDGES